MKKIVLVIGFASLFSCEQKKVKDPHITRIEKDIRENALNIDIGYQEGNLDTVLMVSTKQAIADLGKQLERSFPDQLSEAIVTYTGVYEEARRNNDNDVFHVWKNIVERMQRLKTQKPEQIDYQLYKYTYSINNMLDPKSKNRTEVSSYFLFNQADSLVGHFDQNKLDIAKRNFIKSDLQPFDFIKISLETGVEL